MDVDLRDLERVNQRFRAEAERHRLRFRCEHCVHVVASSLACSMDFPNDCLLGDVAAILPDGSLTFCKHFSLGESG